MRKEDFIKRCEDAGLFVEDCKRKKNGVLKDCLTIRFDEKQKMGVSKWYDDSTNWDVPIDFIIEKLNECKDVVTETFAEVDNFERIKDKVYKVLLNEKALVDCPSEPFYKDIKIGYILMFERGVVTITDDFMKTVKITQDDLRSAAKTMEPNVMDMEHFIMRTITGGNIDCHMTFSGLQDAVEKNENQLIIISTEAKFYGAGALLDENILKLVKFYDLKICPSSKHEVIIALGRPDEKALYDLVREVNRDEVDEVDFLSDEVIIGSEIEV